MFLMNVEQFASKIISFSEWDSRVGEIATVMGAFVWEGERSEDAIPRRNEAECAVDHGARFNGVVG